MAEGKLPDGYTVKKRKLVKADAWAPVQVESGRKNKKGKKGKKLPAAA